MSQIPNTDYMPEFFVPISNFHMWVTFAIIVFAMVAYASERIALEVSSILLIAILLLFFYLFPITDEFDNKIITSEKLLMGFANPALITILCLLVLGQAVIQTGALNGVANLILKISGHNMIIASIISLMVVLLISGVLNNTPVVVIFIPIMSALASSLKVPVSKVMMPLSYAAIVGGGLTLIGSSTNLLVNAQVKKMGLPGLDFFEFTVIGLVVASICLVYIIFILPRFLPAHGGLAESVVGEEKERQFVAQLEIEFGSDLAGSEIKEGVLPEFEEVSIRMVQRGEHAFLPPFEDDMHLRVGDVVVVSGTRKTLADLIAKKPENLSLSADQGYSTMQEDDEDDEGLKRDTLLAEVVVAPGSRMIGQTLEQVGFRHYHNCVVMGIQRHSRVIRAKVTEIRLAAGDVLLIMGKSQDVLSLHGNPELLLMEWSTEEIRSGQKSFLTNIIFFSVVGVAAFGIVPIEVSAFMGAALIILTGGINLRQAGRALDTKIIMLVAASLAMGTALQDTGGANYIAEKLVHAMHGASPTMVMSALFVLMMICTNVLSNNACAVLFTPIAINTALQLNVDPMMFIVSVVFATACSFATPMGYQTNLLVMAPGHYRFMDFLKAGIPLAIILWIIFIIFAPWYYGF